MTKKCAFNNLKKITHYYNNGFEEDIYYTHIYKHITYVLYIYYISILYIYKIDISK